MSILYDFIDSTRFPPIEFLASNSSIFRVLQGPKFKSASPLCILYTSVIGLQFFLLTDTMSEAERNSRCHNVSRHDSESWTSDGPLFSQSIVTVPRPATIKENPPKEEDEDRWCHWMPLDSSNYQQQ